MGTTTSSKLTWIDQGTDFCGNLKSSCGLVINGAFEGEVEAPELTVSETGVVHGTVRVSRLRSEGLMAGLIDADQVQLAGEVLSDTRVVTSVLELKLTASEGKKLEVAFGAPGEGAIGLSSESAADTADTADVADGPEAKATGRKAKSGKAVARR